VRTARLLTVAAVAAALAAAALVAGCGDAPKRAALYHAEKLLYEARKAETAARLGTEPPDSTTLLRLRSRYLRVRAAAPGPYTVAGSPADSEIAMSTIRTVGIAETQAVRIAIEARRPDLGLEAARRLESEVAGDAVTARQAAFMAVAAYQALRRFDDAAAKMKEIVKTYEPLPPGESGEDPVLGIPEALVNLRRNLGDDDGAARELRDALTYYQGLLAKPRPPALEAQIRARLLRTYLELGQASRGLEEVAQLERLVTVAPPLRPMLAEVHFAKGKIRATLDRDPSDGVAILDRIAVDYPTSHLAPRSMFEAAALLESKGNYEAAKERYQSLLQRFPNAMDVAPIALYRLGITYDRMGNWPASKGILESVPARYPRSPIAAQAPMAIIQHYLAENRKTMAQEYLVKALETYRGLIERDSTGYVAPHFRVKMFQIYASRGDSSSLYAITDEMLRNDPHHPYTAQALLEASRAAGRFGNSARRLAYLRRFTQDFPKSPLVPQVKKELRAAGG
jgi:tetratricopeptide (TPR) repeat protein